MSAPLRLARRTPLLLRSLLVSAVACSVSLASAPLALAQPAEAKAQLAAGAKASRAKDWAGAARAYQASLEADRSAAALEGLADARYELSEWAEAHAAYTALLREFGAKLSRGQNARATARLKELSEKTGELSISVNEAGADISVDGKPAGKSPLAAPLRLSAGPHQVRVTKDGFAPFGKPPNVAAGAVTKLEVTLVAESTTTKISVREKAGEKVRVLVDGVDVGEAPWTGDVEPGTHEISIRGQGLAAAPQRISVERGKAQSLEFVASSTTAPVKLATSDGKGLIYVDGKVVGEGSFNGDLPAGPHKIAVTREGYDRFEEDVTLVERQPLSRTITLKLVSAIDTGPVEKSTRPLEGIYGGFGFIGTVIPGGTGNDVQAGCESPPAELDGCSSPKANLGAGLTGFVGYHWQPVGVELFLAGQYDQSSPEVTFKASTLDPGIGPDPARTESFAFRRAGGLAALRVRYTAQTERLRFSAALGAGFAFRTVVVSRDTTSKVDGARDFFSPDAVSYWSPAISFEPSFQIRLGEPTAIAVGMAMILESASLLKGQPTSTAPSGDQRLGASGLTTPGYIVAEGVQVYIGPYIGMMFGP